MPSEFIEQLDRRLWELGCPKAKLQRLVREIAEHREDLKEAALREGLAETEAETEANIRLGSPNFLAEQQMRMVRQSTWWGRHFFLGFCLLPLLLFPVFWGVALSIDFALGFALGYGWDQEKLKVASDIPASFHHLAIAVYGADFLAIALVTLFFCWLAHRSAVGLKWMLTACGICSFWALVMWIQIRPHNFAMGVSNEPQWSRAVVPLLIAGAIYAFRRRKAQGDRQRVTA